MLMKSLRGVEAYVESTHDPLKRRDPPLRKSAEEMLMGVSLKKRGPR